MTYTWLNKQGVQSDEGFSLQRSNRFSYEYTENSKVMKFEGESMFAGLGEASFGFSFDRSWRTATWQAPHASVAVTKADRDRIVGNILDAIRFMGGVAEFM